MMLDEVNIWLRSEVSKNGKIFAANELQYLLRPVQHDKSENVIPSDSEESSCGCFTALALRSA